MKKSRTLLIAAAAIVLAAGTAASVFSAQAQTQSGERIVGYSVYAHSQYTLVQRADGSLRSCKINRQTALDRAPRWECTALPALP